MTDMAPPPTRKVLTDLSSVERLDRLYQDLHEAFKAGVASTDSDYNGSVEDATFDTGDNFEAWMEEDRPDLLKTFYPTLYP